MPHMKMITELFSFTGPSEADVLEEIVAWLKSDLDGSVVSIHVAYDMLHEEVVATVAVDPSPDRWRV